MYITKVKLVLKCSTMCVPRVTHVGEPLVPRPTETRRRFVSMYRWFRMFSCQRELDAKASISNVLSAHSLCFSVTFCFVNEMLDGYDNYWAISKQLMRVRLVNIIAGIPVLNFSKQCLRTFYMFRQILVRKFLWELVYFVVFCSM